MEVNYLAIFVATVSSMVLGAIWYGPLFGKTWLKLTGISEKAMKSAPKAEMKKMYLTGFVSYFILAWALYYLGNLLGYETTNEWATLGFWVGLLFVGVGAKPDYIWTKRPKKLWLMNAAFGAVSMAVMGVVLVLV